MGNQNQSNSASTAHPPAFELGYASGYTDGYQAGWTAAQKELKRNGHTPPAYQKPSVRVRAVNETPITLKMLREYREGYLIAYGMGEHTGRCFCLEGASD